MKCPTCLNEIKTGSVTCPFCQQELCEDCGALLAPDSTTCPQCGASYGIYCTDCNAEVTPNATVCPYCGAVFEDSPEDAIPAGSKADVPFTGRCPQCQIPLYIMDGFCTECGQAICPACGAAVDDYDDICPNCETALFFDCPSCGQEILAAAPSCPSCSTFFVRYCPACGKPIMGAPDSCPSCSHTLQHRQRPAGHRVAFSYLVACPQCETHFDPNRSPCPECWNSVCIQCLRLLYPEDKHCPVCGAARPKHTTLRCSVCGAGFELGALSCPICEQELCTECGAAIPANSARCDTCGAEFECYCPNCQTPLADDMLTCPECGMTFDE
ncbi:MAG: zinc ribbon domain-containing protein [Anaerolineales bacterium]|nr:zinc ribbon domain-containing protein [Anaerolineales bacterium]